MLIKNKKTFYDLAMQGLCGNTPRMWENNEVLLSFWFKDTTPLNKKFGIRNTKGTNGFVLTSMTALDIDYEVVHSYLNEGDYIISEVPEDNPINMQGELGFINGDLYLYYTLKDGVMRNSLRDSPNHALGFAVSIILQKYLDQNDYFILMELLEKYSNEEPCVIEFSNCKYTWGSQNRNLIIWEVRHY